MTFLSNADRPNQNSHGHHDRQYLDLTTNFTNFNSFSTFY